MVYLFAGMSTDVSTKQPDGILDLFGRPLRDLRISVTDRCNFRCTFCMPAEIFGERYRFLPKDDILTFEEISRVARLFVGLGVRKLRLTGGEPLLRDQLEVLIKQLASIDGLEDLALTTNGYLLAKRAQSLRDAGLRRVTVSLHTLDDQIFGHMNGRGFGTGRVLEGIRAAEEAGLTPIKINVVVQKGVNEHTIVDLTRRVKEMGHILRFIEFMDVGNLNQWDSEQVVASQQVIDLIGREMPLEARGQELPGRGRRPVSLCRWERGGGGNILGKQPVLRGLHESPHFRRGQDLHLPIRIQRPRSSGGTTRWRQ